MSPKSGTSKKVQLKDIDKKREDRNGTKKLATKGSISSITSLKH